MPIRQKPFQQLADRQIRRLRDQPKKIVTVRIEFRAARLALLARPAFAVRKRPAYPDNRCCLANTEPRRGLPRRAPRQRGVYHPISQILAVGSRHARPPGRYPDTGLALFAPFVNPEPNRKSMNTL